jgi:hypothetical protein
MQDDSVYDNLIHKIRLNTNALKSRNITAGGLLQMLKVVVYRQILYPTTFANTSTKDVASMQQMLDSALRSKLRVPNYIHSAFFHAHEDMGGLGENTLIDLINIQRVITVLHCIASPGPVSTVIQGGLERLAKYAGVTMPYFSTAFTHTTDTPQGMWLYNIKEWMETNNLSMSPCKQSTTLPRPTYHHHGSMHKTPARLICMAVVPNIQPLLHH